MRATEIDCPKCHGDRSIVDDCDLCDGSGIVALDPSDDLSW